MNLNRDLEKDILLAKNTIEHPEEFEDYKIYHTLTENAKQILNSSNSKFENAFGIIGSFDEALDMISLGCKNITLCDTNPLTYYNAELVKSAILCLEKQEFIEFRLAGKKPFDNQLYQRIAQYLAPDIKTFWDTLFKSYGNEFVFNHLFLNAQQFYNTDLYEIIEQFNHYLKLEYYENAKQSIIKHQVETIYYIENLYQLPDEVWEKKYDEVHLSNVALKNIPIEEHISYMDNKIYPSIRPNGEIMGLYLSVNQMYAVEKEKKHLLEQHGYIEKRLPCKIPFYGTIHDSAYVKTLKKESNQR